MHPLYKFRCEDCGQITEVNKVGTLTTVAPKACPWCASTAVTAVKSSFDSLKAECFSKHSPELVTLLCEQWASPLENEDDPKEEFPFFIDYLRTLAPINPTEEAE